VFFLQNNYGKELEDKMTTNIQNAAISFEERIKALLHIRVENIDQNVASIKTGVSNIMTDVGDVKKLIEGFKMLPILEDLLNGIVADVDCSYPSIKFLSNIPTAHFFNSREVRKSSTDFQGYGDPPA
jgi:hypothetical protein